MNVIVLGPQEVIANRFGAHYCSWGASSKASSYSPCCSAKKSSSLSTPSPSESRSRSIMWENSSRVLIEPWASSSSFVKRSLFVSFPCVFPLFARNGETVWRGSGRVCVSPARQATLYGMTDRFSLHHLKHCGSLVISGCVEIINGLV